MKRFLIIVALLMLAVNANAANIQSSIEPGSGGPEVWVDVVYNASNTDFDAGDVVVWNIGDSTGDNDLWVTTQTTGGAAQNNLIAGVVYPVAIASGDIGSIAIWGTGIPVDVASGVTTAGDELCIGTSLGDAKECLNTDPGIYSSFGICTSAPASSSCKALITIR